MNKYVDKIWQNMARKQLEDELNFLTTNDNEKIKLPIDDNINYLKMYSDTHKTPEEELEEIIDKATKEVKELYEIAKEQDSDNVNLIDRLEIILNILKGEDND